MGNATATPPARAGRIEPRPPRALQPRKLTIARAIDQWAETTLAIEGLRTLQREAADVLIAHAEKTGRRSFKDRIAVVQTGGSLVLDQAKVKEHLIALGERLADFQARTKLGLSLKLLR